VRQTRVYGLEGATYTDTLHHWRDSTQAGPVRFIQLHIELANELSLLRAHAIADDVEAQLMKAFPGADIIVHMDPEIVAVVEGSLKR
jgi:ferrous-iron efflux pump FieF